MEVDLSVYMIPQVESLDHIGPTGHSLEVDPILVSPHVQIVGLLLTHNYLPGLDQRIIGLILVCFESLTR